MEVMQVAAELDFATFVREHTNALYRSAFLLTGERASAQDLVQETFVRLYPSWHRVQTAPIPIAYVRRSLMNNFLNSRRGFARHEVVVDALPTVPSRDGDPAALVSDRDLVVRLLARQSPRDRAVLVMRYFDDVPDDTIAAELGIRRGTVRSIVSRTLADMREAARNGADR